MSYMLSGGYATSEKVKQIQAPTLVLWGAQVGRDASVSGWAGMACMNERASERDRTDPSLPPPKYTTNSTRLKH